MFLRLVLWVGCGVLLPCISQLEYLLDIAESCMQGRLFIGSSCRWALSEDHKLTRCLPDVLFVVLQEFRTG